MKNFFRTASIERMYFAIGGISGANQTEKTNLCRRQD